MATAATSNFISEEERRWVLIGVCLTKVLTPALRNVLATEIPKWHQALCQSPTEIDKQVYGRHKIQLNPSTLDLNYKNINNNHVIRSPRLFDYTVKDPNVSKILALGSEEYILNSDVFVEPWNNCILVGTRKNSVSLKSNNDIVLLKYMLTNLSFHFDKGGLTELCCIPGSFVKILKCNFTSNDEDNAAVRSEGDFNAEHCNFTSSCNGLVCTGQGNAFVVDCSFCNNKVSGLKVHKGGTLNLKRCVSNNDGHGVVVGPEASKCSVFNWVVHNAMVGIVSEDSKSVCIGRNNCF